MNVTIDKSKKTLTIVMPLEGPTVSGSGKNLTIASTHGNRASDAKFDGKLITVGVNAYVPA